MDKHCKTIYESVRIGYSSGRVQTWASVFRLFPVPPIVSFTSHLCRFSCCVSTVFHNPSPPTTTIDPRHDNLWFLWVHCRETPIEIFTSKCFNICHYLITVSVCGIFRAFSGFILVSPIKDSTDQMTFVCSKGNVTIEIYHVMTP